MRLYGMEPLWVPNTDSDTDSDTDSKSGAHLRSGKQTQSNQLSL